MFGRRNLLDDFEFPDYNIIKRIYQMLYYIFIIPLRIINLCFIKYYLWNCNTNKIKDIPVLKEEPIPGKIISWNIQFGNNLWGQDTFSEMIKYLQKERPEIIILQEVLRSNKINQVEILKEKLNMEYCAYNSDTNLINFEIGDLILSNVPIDDINIFSKFMVVETNIKNEKINLINTHLTCDFTFQKQKEEIGELLNFMDSNPNQNYIIAGDFNLNTSSSSIQRIEKKMKNITNRLYTFPSNYPLVKIDYVFSNCQNYNLELDVPEVTYSVHLPLIFYLTDTY